MTEDRASVLLMAELQCFPTWLERGGSRENLDPAELPIDPALRERLIAWADKWDTIYDLDDPATAAFASDADEAKFDNEGWELARALRLALKERFYVEYFSVKARKPVRLD